MEDLDEIKQRRQDINNRALIRIQVRDFVIPRDGTTPTRQLVQRRKCKLCFQKFSRQELIYHIKSFHHVRNQNSILDMEQNCVELFNCQRRIARLGCEKWRNHLYAELLPMFTTSFCRHLARNMIRPYEERERVMLLQLAAWKMMCLSNPSTKPDDNFLAWKEFEKKGWKINKDNDNIRSKTELLMKLIDPFVDKSIMKI